MNKALGWFMILMGVAWFLMGHVDNSVTCTCTAMILFLLKDK